MYEYRSKEAVKASIFTHLKELGADYAEAYYSGGNDEGGIDGVTLFNGQGEDGQRITLALSESLSWESPIYKDFDDLLELDFGSWAGEFEAHGTVYANVTENRIWRSGSMSTYTDDPDAGEY